jgi:heat shock protein HtpX
LYNQIAANKRRSWILLGGFLVLVSALGYVISLAVGDRNLFWVIMVGSVIYAAVTYFASAQIALAMSGAREVQKRDAPELYRLVENLAITAGLPTPKVYIIDDPSPNAFATGRDPQHAVVAVTSGILQILNKTELEGVIAHELSHVGNYDIRFMAFVVALVSVVAVVSDLFLRMSFWGGFGGRDRDRESNEGWMIAVGIIGAILAPLVAAILQMAISRRREYLADSSGALLTRYPEGLASALEKIDAAPKGLEHVSSATSPLYIANPLKGRGGEWMEKLFSTHPPIADRIAKLREMEKTV